MQLFIYGGVVRQMSEKDLEKWVKALLSTNIGSDYFVALDLFSMYYPKDTLFPEGLAYEILTSPSRFNSDVSETAMSEYHLHELSDHYITLPTARNIQLIDFLLDRLVTKHYFTAHEPESLTLLNLCQRDPENFWSQFELALNRGVENNTAWALAHWLGHSSYDPTNHQPVSALKWLSSKSILSWIEINPEIHAPIIANGTPVRFNAELESDDFLPKLLISYGHIEPVRLSLISNLHSDVWSGSMSIHFTHKLNNLNSFSARQNNLNIKIWCEAAESLKATISNASAREERDEW
jgi:hypothetical protein